MGAITKKVWTQENSQSEEWTNIYIVPRPLKWVDEARKLCTETKNESLKLFVQKRCIQAGFGKYTVILQNNTYPVYGKQKNIIISEKQWKIEIEISFAVVIDTK